jgi:C4-dicarboxylate-specific signal transduction histidine kinase
MEKKLRESERLLHQAQKMEAVGRLAGGIAHDFNNILTAIMGYTNLLAEEIGDSSSLREDVEGVRKAANRAEALPRQLLAFSRRQPMEPRVVESGEMLRDMERMLKRLLPANVNLMLRPGEKSLFIRIDPTQFEQVILNTLWSTLGTRCRPGAISRSAFSRARWSPPLRGRWSGYRKGRMSFWPCRIPESGSIR